MPIMSYKNRRKLLGNYRKCGKIGQKLEKNK